MNRVELVQNYFKTLLDRHIFNSDHVLMISTHVLRKLANGEYDELADRELLAQLGAEILEEFNSYHWWYDRITFGETASLPPEFYIKDAYDDCWDN